MPGGLQPGISDSNPADDEITGMSTLITLIAKS